MKECYHFENIEYTDGLLNDCVDATYIIHLEGNGRMPRIKKQLEEYHPSNQVYILFNKGFKKCTKAEYVDKPPIDLIDAFFQCFQHAEENAYKNILILEDDFIFSEKIKEKGHCKNICEFINSKEGEPLCYRVGTIPFIQYPCTIDFTHYKGFMGGAHCVIYNKLYRDHLMQIDKDTIHDWDVFNNFFVNAYTYYVPLCYQLIPETENSKHWGISNFITLLAGKILFFIFQLLGLNTSTEPGYSIFYMFSKILFFVVVIFFIWVAFLLLKFIRNIKPKTRK